MATRGCATRRSRWMFALRAGCVLGEGSREKFFPPGSGRGVSVHHKRAREPKNEARTRAKRGLADMSGRARPRDLLEFVSPFRRVLSLLFRLVRSSPVFFRREINIRRLHVQRACDPVLSMRSKPTPVGLAARAGSATGRREPKPANEAAGAAADPAERRAMAEGNRRRQGAGGTRSRGTRETRSERIRNGTAVIYPRLGAVCLIGRARIPRGGVGRPTAPPRYDPYKREGRTPCVHTSRPPPRVVTKRQRVSSAKDFAGNA